VHCFQGRPGWTASLTALTGADLGRDPGPNGEDCLYVEIVVPNKPRSSSLPVVVSIHGGGYVLGSIVAGMADTFTADADGSLIYVQIQYRLGAYGFLAGPEVTKDGTQNAGLLDQRSALDWVQRNIKKFGGDPKKVTIWGGSAGGGSVMAQLALNGGKRPVPFRAAIAGKFMLAFRTIQEVANEDALADFPGVLPMRSKDVLNAQ